MDDFENGFGMLSDPDKYDLPTFANFLNREMNGSRLLDYIQDKEGPFKGSRKEFCDVLGIGESTLSGWLKGEVPKAAKLVVGLLMDRGYLHREIKRLESDLSESEDRLVSDGDCYMIVNFPNASSIGSISARDIPDETTGTRLISHHDLKRKLQLLYDAWRQSKSDEDEDEDYDDYVRYEVEMALGPQSSGEMFSFDVHQSEAGDSARADQEMPDTKEDDDE